MTEPLELHGRTAAAERVSPIALSKSRYPTGWFQVAWSDDLPIETVRLVRYFNQDIVLWRGASGRVNATDAYCLHLGANLGVGGRVEGDCIVCPWHAWRWNGEGRNTLIPYSSQTCKKHLQLRTYPVRERHGGIHLWHDLAGRPPFWEPPLLEQLDGDPRYYPVDHGMRAEHRVKTHPQLVVENGVDPAHIPNIHGAGEMPTIESVSTDGHMWRTRISAAYGAGKGRTWMTPDGALTVTLEWNLWGLGMGTSEWPPELGSLIMWLCTTPVDETFSDIRLCLTARRQSPDDTEPPPAVRKMIEHQMRTVTQDFFIWENMKVLHVPNFAPEEATNYGRMRKWARQFYPEEEG